MHRFYVPDIESSLSLPEEEARHCVKVLRLAEGDRVEVVDGVGNLFICRLDDAGLKHCSVSIEKKQYVPNHWGCDITIAIAPTKNIDRLEWMVEKVVEMGVDRIIPVACRYSERKVLKNERLRKIAVSAMKQSLKTRLPVIDELTPVEDVIAAGYYGMRYIAYCDRELERRDFVKEYVKGSNALVLIGPEGDFSKEEIRSAVGAGFVPVSLGESRLRTETAGMFACAAIHTINQL